MLVWYSRVCLLFRVCALFRLAVGVPMQLLDAASVAADDGGACSYANSALHLLCFVDACLHSRDVPGRMPERLEA
jgi:hypothetical protein